MNILNMLLIYSFFILSTGCIVVPEVAETQQYQCGLSSDKKTLKIVNLTDGDTSYYKWNDEVASIVTIPTSAIVSSVYVAVNNLYHIGEKQIKCV